MKEEDNKIEVNVIKWLSKSKQHTTSLDFNSSLMRRLAVINDIRLERKKYFKRAAVMVGITIVLGFMITFALSGLNDLFSAEEGQLNEVVQVFLLSIVLILGGLILYVGNSFGQYRRNALA